MRGWKQLISAAFLICGTTTYSAAVRSEIVTAANEAHQGKPKSMWMIWNMFSKSETGPLIGTKMSASDRSSWGTIILATTVGFEGIGGTMRGGRSDTSTPPLGAFVAYDRRWRVLNMVLCGICDCIEVFESLLLKDVLNKAARQFGSAFLLTLRAWHFIKLHKHKYC